MRDRERHDRLDRMRFDIMQLTEEVSDRKGRYMPRHKFAAGRLDEYRTRGFPEQSQNVGSSGGGVGDPVGQLVAAANPLVTDTAGNKHAVWRSDQFDTDRAELDAAIEAAGLALIRARKIAVRYSEDVTRKAIAASCLLCEELGRTVTVYADDRCSWHWQFRRDWGIDAHSELGRQHLERPGSYITERLVKQYHPDVERQAG